MAGVPRCAGATVGRMAVVVVLASRTPKEVVVSNPPTLAVDAGGALNVTFLSSEGDTVTVAYFERALGVRHGCNRRVRLIATSTSLHPITGRTAIADRSYGNCTLGPFQKISHLCASLWITGIATGSRHRRPARAAAAGAQRIVAPHRQAAGILVVVSRASLVGLWGPSCGRRGCCRSSGPSCAVSRTPCRGSRSGLGRVPADAQGVHSRTDGNPRPRQ